MASATAENIYFQDKIPVILTTCLELETYIKGHHVYKEIWTPELGKQLNVPMEPCNRVDKSAVYDILSHSLSQQAASFYSGHFKS